MHIRLLAYGAAFVALASWASIRDENKNVA
jgi:hypothetical protein